MNELKVFENTEFGKFGIMLIDGKEYFPATKCAEILGYKNPQDAVRAKCKGVRKMLTPSAGGMQEANYISEGDLYRLIASSKLPAAQKFEQWIFDEIVPSIRKHGAYMTPEVIEQTLMNPDYIIRLATAIKEERAKNEQLEKINAEQQKHLQENRPKIVFAESVETSKTSILIGELAKLIRQNGYPIGQNRLFEWLRENGYLIKGGSSRNSPTQKSMEMRLMETKVSTINNPDGSIRETRTTKITGKGQIYFINQFIKMNDNEKSGGD